MNIMMVFDSTHFSVIREQFSLKEINLAIKLSQMMGYQWKKTWIQNIVKTIILDLIYSVKK